MRRLLTVLIISIILAIALFVLAFIYIDFSGHTGFCYDLMKGDKFFGSVRVDKYVTEDKVVYKSSSAYPFTTDYASISEKLFLKKRTFMPVKFIKEEEGAKGSKRVTLLVQKEDRTDFLFLEHPRFIALEGFETGEKTMVFSPEDIMLYMPVISRYNFWKKGAQFFEVMIPTDEVLPPIRDKIEVRYLKDEYLPIMGRRVEAESFSVTARTIPEAKVFVSKYTHRVLALEIPSRSLRFTLTSFIESPGKRFIPIVSKVISALAPGGEEALDKELAEGALPKKEAPALKKESQKAKEVFFESEKILLAGRMWMPEGEGAFPAVIFVPKDGPMKNGEIYLINSLGEFLSSQGFIMLSFDRPGRGKSQSALTILNDEKRVQNITGAISFLEKNPSVRANSINLIGYEGGGYLALKAAKTRPSVSSCILLEMPLARTEKSIMDKPSAENLQALLSSGGFGPPEEDFMKTVLEKVHNHLKGVTGSKEDFKVFMSTKVPLKEYRDFIARRAYDEVLSFERPLLLIFGKDNKYFDPQASDELKKELSKKPYSSKVAVFRNLGPFMLTAAEKENSWSFSVNKDVLELVKNWLNERGTQVKPEEPKELPAATPKEENNPPQENI